MNALVRCLGLSVGLAAMVACGSASPVAGPSDADGSPSEELTQGTDGPTSTQSPTGRDRPASMQSVTQVQVIDSMTYLAVFAARELGYFEEESIDLETLTVSSPQAAISALLAGDGDYFMASPVAAAHAADGGADILLWATVFDQPLGQWILQAELAESLGLSEDSSLEERLAMLEGLSLGFVAPNDPIDLLFRYVASQEGWDVERDFDVQYLGPDGMLPAFSQGRIDVLMGATPLPELAIEQFGGVELLSMPQGDYRPLQGFVSVAAMSRGEWVRENPEAIDAWQRAVERGMSYLAENTELANELVERVEAFSAFGPAVVERALSNVIPGIPENTELTVEQVEAALRVQRDAFGEELGIGAADLLP